jgi:hypothetical protein
MVAVAIVAVMSGGTSSAQAALETTLAREEIDTQAEALRFIHSSYVASKNAKNKETPIIKLWKDIAGRATNLEGKTDEAKQAITHFEPTSCQDLYRQVNSSDPYAHNTNSFIINPRKLGDKDLKGAIVKFDDEKDHDKFHEASTYPRLIYGNSPNQNDDQSGLADTSNTYSELYRAEGIYIVAVKDKETTKLYNTDKLDTERVKHASAFYDFYIRTCWYGTDAEEPSTISTVIRLYDPDALK